MRILAKVAYRGTAYQGWQKQINASSVQEEIEKVLSRILNTPVAIQGSGRTDAGVHARGQRFHFDAEGITDLPRFVYSVNCLLPRDISVLSMEVVEPDFHARFSAKGKVYLYRILLGERDVFLDDFAYDYPMPLDQDLFLRALSMFRGKHDFRNFCSKPEDEEGFVRTVFSIDTEYDEKTRELDVLFRGDGFMRYQIRFMVGTALAVGSGRVGLDYVSAHLDSGAERDVTNLKAPAKGLYLLDVLY